MNQFSNNDYPEYPVFKGLQRPLEFMGLRGRYIYWAASTAGAAILSFIINLCHRYLDDYLQANEGASHEEGVSRSPRL